MAVTKMEKVNTNSTLQTLTAAALLLPGLTAPAVEASENDQFSFQYGHYEESKRDLAGVNSQYKPITVDSLQSSGKINLTDRIKFAFNFIQDTWSGATPITTAPSGRRGNQPYTQFGVVSGASPYLQTGGSDFSTAEVYFDKELNPLLVDPESITLGNVTSLGRDQKLAHTMSTASPETRKEGNFKLGYEWDEAAVDIGGGISVENDYESRFGNIGARFDFNQKRTTLDTGLSYTNSDSFARLSSHFTQPYLNYTAYQSQLKTIANDPSGDSQILGKRDDWAGSLGLAQVVNKDALFKLGVGFTHSQGYLENPYKAVTAFFIQPVGGSIGETSATIPYVGQAKTFLEQRPDYRNQWNFSTGWVQYINLLDAALHLDYKFFHDDWGINAHTFEGNWVQSLGAGWTVTPRMRYYSQSAADFYHPYLIVGSSLDPGNAQQSTDNSKLSAAFSSDHRLSGYGALSGGIILSKQFSKGVRLDAGFEYYTHQGDLKLGGHGEADYADFNYFVANASVNVNLSSLGRSLADDPHAHHKRHDHLHGAALPAGVMFGHVMSTPGDVMVGYRYMYSRQDGNMLFADKFVADQTIINSGCAETGGTCRTVPEFMNMHMHMLDIMYAATDWLSLMVMPQFMDMDMNARSLSGVSPAPSPSVDHLHGGHNTGGVGDTGIYALFKLFETQGHHVNLGLGVTAPTGKVDIKLNRMHEFDSGYIHYGMQLGSGTWDFRPSLTYTGQSNDWSWGAQINGTKRMEDRNASGFALGDAIQTSAWGSYSLFSWLSASVRGVYTVQGAVKGGFPAIPGDCPVNYDQNSVVPCADVNPKGGSMDNPKNYGGHYWDVGFGLNATIADGTFAGHNFSVEWLQPVQDKVYGYQLERDGTLNATWMYAF